MPSSENCRAPIIPNIRALLVPNIKPSDSSPELGSLPDPKRGELEIGTPTPKRKATLGTAQFLENLPGERYKMQKVTQGMALKSARPSDQEFSLLFGESKSPKKIQKNLNCFRKKAGLSPNPLRSRYALGSLGETAPGASKTPPEVTELPEDLPGEIAGQPPTLSPEMETLLRELASSPKRTKGLYSIFWWSFGEVLTQPQFATRIKYIREEPGETKGKMLAALEEMAARPKKTRGLYEEFTRSFGDVITAQDFYNRICRIRSIANGGGRAPGQ